MKPIEIEDILKYKFLSNISYAPGGKRAAFTVSAANVEENSYEQCLWLYENDEVRQITSLGKEGQFIWLDKNRIIFPAFRTTEERKKAEKKEPFTPLYVLDLKNGGEALHLMDLPFAAGKIKCVDSRYLAVAASVDKKYPDLYAASDEDREKYLKDVESEKDYEVFDEIPFWSNGHGVTNGNRDRLFAVDINSGEVIPLTDAEHDLLEFTVSGENFYFAYNERKPKLKIKGFTLDVFNTSDRSTKNVLVNEDLSFAEIEEFGNDILIFGSECKRYGLNENTWVYRLDKDNAKLDILRREEYCMYGSVGSDVRLGGGKINAVSGDYFYHLMTREGDCILCRMDHDGSDEPVITKPGSIDAFDIAGNTALMIALYDMKPQELYKADLTTGEVTKVSAFNDDAVSDRYIAEPIQLDIRSHGTDITGWVFLPRNYDPEKSYPAVLDIHGGPKTVYGPVFYHEMQVWAGMGYFVFFCNPTGSDGRDNEFMDIRGKYGTVDYDNIMDFVDAVLDQYPQIDRNRICETGGSYGGFMTNWIITHTDRFCCAASQRSISNWLSFWGNSDIGFFFASDQNDADLYDSPEKLWERSPLKYAKGAKTPTLFIHSDEDYRCPLEQGLQMYSALVEQGIESRLCMFHGENHELSRSGKPKHRIRRLKEITDWFEKYASRA